MPKIKIVQDAGGVQSAQFYCPGCKTHHSLIISHPQGRHPIWTFNDDLEKPTFLPSLLVNKDDPARRCHLYIDKGCLNYLADCWHELAGQKIKMHNI